MKNIISKSFTTIALASISIFITIIVFYFGGIILGNILNPPHVHHYECVCDQPPVLTILEGTIWGAIYLIILIFGFNYILFKIDFNKIERYIALSILFLSNLFTCYQIGIILCTQVSG